MRQSNTVLLATSNLDKFNEFKSLFHEYPEIELFPAHEFVRNVDGLKHAEKFDTYMENAIAKARLINHASSGTESNFKFAAEKIIILKLPERGIQPFSREKLFVISLFDDLSSFENNDRVGEADG